MILVECYSDKLFVEIVISVPKSQVQHKRIGWGRGNILKILNNPLNQKNIGIVDEDSRTQLEYAISKFHLLQETQNLLFYRNQENCSFLIVLRPKFEDWLIDVCKSSKINLKQYRLVADSSYLHKLSTERGCDRFKLLFNILKESNSPKIKTLKEMIQNALQIMK